MHPARWILDGQTPAEARVTLVTTSRLIMALETRRTSPDPMNYISISPNWLYGATTKRTHVTSCQAVNSWKDRYCSEIANKVKRPNTRSFSFVFYYVFFLFSFVVILQRARWDSIDAMKNCKSKGAHWHSISLISISTNSHARNRKFAEMKIRFALERLLVWLDSFVDWAARDFHINQVERSETTEHFSKSPLGNNDMVHYRGEYILITAHRRRHAEKFDA